MAHGTGRTNSMSNGVIAGVGARATHELLDSVHSHTVRRTRSDANAEADGPGEVNDPVNDWRSPTPVRRCDSHADKRDRKNQEPALSKLRED